jgi:hypothetical protein
MVPLADNVDSVNEIAEIAREFRAAVISGAHERAEQLAWRYVEAVSALWQSLAPSERASSPLVSQAPELLQWARLATLIHRNLAADQLSVLQKASRYQPAAMSHCLQVSA